MNLDDNVDQLPFVGAAYQKRLEKLNITSINDLIHHAPSRYLDFRKKAKIKDLQIDEVATIVAKIKSTKNQYTKTGRKIQIVEMADNTGTIKAVWFNQPFLLKVLYPGEEISVAGKISWFGRYPAFISPEYEKLLSGSQRIHTEGLIPVYPETSGVSSKWLRRRIVDALAKVGSKFVEFPQDSLIAKYDFLPTKEAILKIHQPKSLKEAGNARRRLAFNEFLALQIKNLRERKKWQKLNASARINPEEKFVKKFIASLPFELTPSQKKAAREILNDLKKSIPMNRMLEGDVGSGKTVVAAIATIAAIKSGGQVAFMAPTQILANQHFNTLKKLFKPFDINIHLVTGNTKLQIEKGDIFVGTHALIYQKAKFKKLVLVVIDEEQRFGVHQRQSLIKKGKSPHILTMTATPIPRTVALTFYGNLDLSVLTEMPKGRQKIVTWIVPPEKRLKAYKWINNQLKKTESQAYFIFPLIEESDKVGVINVKAAKAEFKKLKKRLTGIRLGLLHGRQGESEKRQILSKFKKGKIEGLVSTPVVEVGIDVPNATIILIESAERFGLAQLHQLRGRVGRSEKKSYCLLLTETENLKVAQRLSALKKTLSGFELAELDLKLRGPGEVFGTRQHGFPELKIASWQDIDLIKIAREVADKLLL